MGSDAVFKSSRGRVQVRKLLLGIIGTLCLLQLGLFGGFAGLLSDYRLIMRGYRLLGALGIRASYGTCPFCEGATTFAPFGLLLRRGELCMRCSSLGRHRALLSLLQSGAIALPTPFADPPASGGRILFFAPEKCFEDWFRRKGYHVTTADLTASYVDLNLDITDTREPEGTYDLIIAMHVLEHVPDDAGSLREMLRILRPGGRFVVVIPQDMSAPATIEGEVYGGAVARYLWYGQHDHVRYYGRDFAARAKAAGFWVEVFGFPELEGQMHADRYRARTDVGLTYCLHKGAPVPRSAGPPLAGGG
jgi:SAM-dependent methyltransferase